MRQNLRNRSFSGLGTGLALDRTNSERLELEQLLRCVCFDPLAGLDDDYESAYNMLATLVWMNNGCYDRPDNEYWRYMVTHGFGAVIPDEEAAELLGDLNYDVGELIDSEFRIVRQLGAPVPSLAAQQPAILSRFKSTFIPAARRMLLTSFYGEEVEGDEGEEDIVLPQNE